MKKVNNTLAFHFIFAIDVVFVWYCLPNVLMERLLFTNGRVYSNSA